MGEPSASAAPASEQAAVFLSIVIPAYNEAARITPTLEKVLEYLSSRPESFEIVVVDDGSADDTVGIVEEFGRRNRAVRLVRNPRNSGKGVAVRNGILDARGEVLLFTDADLSSPIAEAERLLERIRSGCDVAIGSRALRPEWIHPRQSRFRESIGKLFNVFVRMIASLKFRDTQCGFKAFRRQAARAIFASQVIPGFGFDVELLYLACKFGYRTEEVPVHWGNDARTKVRPFRDGFGMFLDLLRIRWNDWSGKYTTPASTA